MLTTDQADTLALFMALALHRAITVHITKEPTQKIQNLKQESQIRFITKVQQFNP